MAAITCGTRRPLRAGLYCGGAIAVLVALEVGLSGAASLGGAGQDRSPSVLPVAARSYVVGRGDTAWSIARAMQPEGDVRPLVHQIQSLREGRPLQVGERIMLP